MAPIFFFFFFFEFRFQISNFLCNKIKMSSFCRYYWCAFSFLHKHVCVCVCDKSSANHVIRCNQNYYFRCHRTHWKHWNVKKETNQNHLQSQRVKSEINGKENKWTQITQSTTHTKQEYTVIKKECQIHRSVGHMYQMDRVYYFHAVRVCARVYV